MAGYRSALEFTLPKLISGDGKAALSDDRAAASVARGYEVYSSLSCWPPRSQSAT
jgi:hypothetical protein